MSLPFETQKRSSRVTATVTPFEPHEYAVPAKPTGRRFSSTVSFIAGAMSMVPNTSGPQKMSISDDSIDEDLHALATNNIVFIRKISRDIEKFINVPNKYQIVTSKGEKLYDIVETTDKLTRRLFRKEQPFTLVVANNQDEYICELHGDPGVGGTRAFVRLKRETVVLGKVVQMNPLFTCCKCCLLPRYNVYDDKGKVVYRIVSERGNWRLCMLPDDFQVYSAAKKKLLVGNISRQTKAIGLEDSCQADMYELSFEDTHMETVHKALLLAAVIMLDFQFFEGRQSNDLWKAGVCCLLFLLIVLLVAGVIVYLVYENSK